MRALRLLHPVDDGSLLVLETADGGEQFQLRVDAPLRDAVRADLPRLTPTVPAAPTPAPAALSDPQSATGEPPIGPREIQVRVRAGESPEALAQAHGMALERIMRFAGPVLAERARIADEARRARARRSTTEGQVVVFGEAVDERFAAHGIDPGAVAWDARRREDGEWLVTAAWLGGGAEHTAQHAAEWVFHRASRSVTPLDDTAADLLSDRPIRPVAPPEPVRPTLSVAPPLVPGIVAFPPMPDAATGPLPHVDEVFDQDAPAADRVAGPAAHASGSAEHRPAHQPTHQPADQPAHQPGDQPAFELDAPPLPLGIVGGAAGALRPVGRRREESEEDRAARARVPSWDDILLGVRRKTDE